MAHRAQHRNVLCYIFESTMLFSIFGTHLPLPPPPRFSPACLALQEIVPIMDLAVNEEFTRMYSEEELMGARRIQARLRLPLPVVSLAVCPAVVLVDPASRRSLRTKLLAKKNTWLASCGIFAFVCVAYRICLGQARSACPALPVAWAGASL